MENKVILTGLNVNVEISFTNPYSLRKKVEQFLLKNTLTGYRFENEKGIKSFSAATKLFEKIDLLIEEEDLKTTIEFL